MSRTTSLYFPQYYLLHAEKIQCVELTFSFLMTLLNIDTIFLSTPPNTAEGLLWLPLGSWPQHQTDSPFLFFWGDWMVIVWPWTQAPKLHSNVRQQLIGVQMLIFSAVAFYYVRLSTNLLLLSSLCVILIHLVRGCSLQGYYGWQLQRAMIQHNGKKLLQTLFTVQ